MTIERFLMTKPVDPDRIGKVYSGKAGCGCGCNGEYYEDERNIKRIVKAINKRIGTGAGAQTDFDGKIACYFVEDPRVEANRWAGIDGKPGRYYWAYVKGGK